MSLLIKALRQAEKQNEQAARRAAEVAIDLPPEAEPSNGQMRVAREQSPLNSALSLAVEAQTVGNTPEKQQPESPNDFPALDEDFAPTTSQHGQFDEPSVLDEDQLNPLSLETVGKLPARHDDETPPEVFARHQLDKPTSLVPAVEPPHAIEPIPVEPDSPKPAQSIPDDPVSEAAPFLAVNAVLPKGRFVQRPLAVLIGLPIIAFLLAAITAATVWWSGDQFYDVDFNAPTALPAVEFAANDQPLSRLNLGVAVEGTGSTASETVSEKIGVAEKFAASRLAVGSATTAPKQYEPPAAPPARRVLTREAVAPSAPAAAARPALPAVRFVRSISSGEQSQQLMNDAYQALQRNELDLAKTAYQQALRIDRNLIDGWVGLASVATRQGNRTLATQHYQRALNIDPNDNVARTGLLALVGANLPDESESTLRTLIGSGQQNAMAELTLANTLARQGRWAEAQQAYFNANTTQPNQPDTVFNLAVSLERIRQSRAALTYYERALVLSKDRQALFDPALARQRIDALKQQLQEQ